MNEDKKQLIQPEKQYEESGQMLCSSLTIALRSEGLLGGPHLLKSACVFNDINISIKLEQMGIRTIELIPTTAVSMSALWSFFCHLELFLMLLDGRFYIVEKAEFSGDGCSETEYAAYASECVRRRLSYCKTDPAYCYSDHCFIRFEDVLTPDVLNKWFVLQNELDIVHQVALYNIADTGVTHDVKCANLIECMEPLTEIINEYDCFFPSLRPGERTTTLKMCVDAVISKFGADIFSKEYSKNKERFLQVLVNTRNRIMHIKRNQPKDKYLSGTESILYLVKLYHLYRVVILALLGIDYALYREAVIKSVTKWDSWEGVLDSFLSGLK